LNPFQKFEKKFPFYHMDINGFMLRVRQAMVAENPEEEKTLYNVKYIALKSMQNAFK
jgi:hypothetical protein